MCDARIRPFPNDTEVECGITGIHNLHIGDLNDQAYPGSKTTIRWFESDRRTFHGEWPGACAKTKACMLPNEHRGDCVI
jgi:hypothetical protein